MYWVLLVWLNASTPPHSIHHVFTSEAKCITAGDAWRKRMRPKNGQRLYACLPVDLR